MDDALRVVFLLDALSRKRRRSGQDRLHVAVGEEVVLQCSSLATNVCATLTRSVRA